MRYEDVNPPTSEPLWHFDNFDRYRELDRFHHGDADGHPFWMMTRMEDIRSAFQQPARFSSRAIDMHAPEPFYKLIPEMLDPPEHTVWRHLLGTWFSPGAVARREPRIRQCFRDLVDEVAGRGRCDFMSDVAQRFPSIIFMEIMGLPVEHTDRFVAWETTILHEALGGEQSLIAMFEVIEYFTALITDRRAEPRAELISDAITWEIDGTPPSDEDLLAMCLLLFMAGLDTVAMQLSYAFLHLATHDDDRRRIVEDPTVIPSAIEEFLRFYSFVTPGRQAVEDTDFNGCPSERARWSTCRSPRPIGILRRSRTPAASSSTGPTSGTSRSAQDRIDASERIWPGSSSTSPWRSGIGASPTTASAIGSRCRSTVRSSDSTTSRWPGTSPGRSGAWVRPYRGG
jgi:cytochrome P450